MALSYFQQLLLGQDPLAQSGPNSLPSMAQSPDMLGAVVGPTVNAAEDIFSRERAPYTGALASPDYAPQQSQAAYDGGGGFLPPGAGDALLQLGGTLLAAGQPMTGAERGALIQRGISSIPSSADVQNNMLKAQQYRLQLQQAQEERDAQKRWSSSINDDALKSAGVPIAADQFRALPIDLQQKIYSTYATRSPLEMQKQQLELQRLQREAGPKTVTVKDAYGNDTTALDYGGGDIRPIGANGSPGMASPMPAQGAAIPFGGNVAIPPGVNPQEYLRKKADEAAKAAATEEAKSKATRDEYIPAYNDYIRAFDKAARMGAIGPVEASDINRKIFSATEKEAARQEVEAAQKRWVYAQAGRVYGKLDRGFTDVELDAFTKQGLPLYAANPESALQSFKGRFGVNGQQQGQSQQPQGQSQAGGVLDRARAAIQGGAPRDAVINRLRQYGIDPSGL